MNFVPAPEWRGDLKRFSERTGRGKQKQPFFFPYKTEITSAREKLLAQRRRREGVYYPKGHRQPSSRSKRDFFRRSRRKGAGGWSPYRGLEHSGLCVGEAERWRTLLPLVRSKGSARQA